MNPALNIFCGLLLLCQAALPVWAEERPVFEIEKAGFVLQETLLLLDSTISIELPKYISIAIDQGFAVPLSFEVEILEVKKYWFDRKIISLKQQYLLHYLPMLNSYVVSDINNSQRNYFDSRKEAVNSLKVIYRYPMLDIGNISRDLKVYAQMRFGLDVEELPLPLKSSSLWDNDWGLRSKWFSWRIDRVQP